LKSKNWLLQQDSSMTKLIMDRYWRANLVGSQFVLYLASGTKSPGKKTWRRPSMVKLVISRVPAV
jgi:hypothetical protein